MISPNINSGAVQLGETEQFQVNLTFDKGVPVEFFVDGSNPIHISGNYLVDSSTPVAAAPAIEAPKQKLDVLPIKSEEPQVNRELDMDTPPRKRKADDDTVDASAQKKALAGPQRVEAKTPKQTPAKTVSLSISEDSPATSPVAAKTPKKSPGTPKYFTI